MTDRATVTARLMTLAASSAPDGHLAAGLGAATQRVLGVGGVAITVRNTTAQRTTVYLTDEIMTRLEDLQDVTGEGPCLDAYRHSTYFAAAIESDPDPRWPEFTRAAWQAVGQLLMYSFPMRPGGDTFGVLSFYLADDHVLPGQLDIAQAVADAVGAALLHDPALNNLNEPGPWSSRAPIHQATGMVIAQLHLPPKDALAVLRAHAYAHNTTLADTAGHVVDRRLNFRPDP